MAIMIGWRAIMIQSRFGLFCFSFLFEMTEAELYDVDAFI
jgi:hypothetical protein